MNRPTRLHTALAFLASAALSACGGGASSYSTTTAASANIASASSSATAATATATNDSVSTTYNLSGVVSGSTTTTVTTTGSGSATTTTDSSGNFSFAELAAGSYTVTPAHSGYVYTPVSRAETLSTESITDVVFNATASTAATYSISGTVSGPVMAGVIVTLNGTNIGSAVTDSSGNYRFAGLESGTYTVNATRSGYTFTAPLIVSVESADATGNDFTSSAAAAGGITFAAITPLPQASVGTSYQTHVVQTIGGGVSPYHYQSGPLDDGAPPLGMIVNPNGELTGTATVPGVYDFTVCAVDAAGEISTCEPTTITVVAAPVSVTPIPTPAPLVPVPAAAVTLSASPASIGAGAGATLNWSSTNATTCTASGGWSGAEASSGSAVVNPTSSTTYTLTCSGTGGVGKAFVLVEVSPPTPVTPTVTLSASTTTMTAGSSATLKWSSKNAAVCSGSGGWSGNQGTSGSTTVSPKSTTTYGLSCTNSSGGSAQASTKITVNTAVVAPTPAPTVTLTASTASIKSGSTSTLTWTAKNADSCTASDGWNGAQADNGTKSVSPTADTTYTLSCSGAGGTTQVSTTVDVSTTTASGTSWVYHDGGFDWPGDYDFAAVANYSDTSGDPVSGAHDIKMTSAPYGGWLPYAQNWDFNSAPYTKLTFSLKPTRTGQRWQVYFVKVGDTPVGIALDVSHYGPTPVVGQWGTYTIPLQDLGVLGKPIYKFAIQDQTGASGNVWYINNVGFVP
jgi:hypothetical protein